MAAAQLVDGGECLRLVQRRQRHQAAQLGEHRVVDDDGAAKLLSAMDHAVRGGQQRHAGKRAVDPIQQQVQAFRVARAGRQCTVEQGRAGAVGGRHSHGVAGGGDLAVAETRI